MRSRSKRTGGSIGSDRYRNREKTDISPMPHLASLVSARVPKRYAHGDVSVSSFILHPSSFMCAVQCPHLPPSHLRSRSWGHGGWSQHASTFTLFGVWQGTRFLAVSSSPLSFGPTSKIGLDQAPSQGACLIHSTTPLRAVRSHLLASQPNRASCQAPDVETCRRRFAQQAITANNVAINS
jgi:hypothetical protein